jgi:hypothetical protein
MSLDFDGQREINQRLERGQSYGLSKAQYGSLAHIAMGALRMAQVEPAEIRTLSDGQPGCDVTLWGRSFQYTIRMTPARVTTALYGLPLDSKLGGLGVELCHHKFKGSDYTGNTLAVILHHEGVTFATLEECQEYLRNQGVDC